MSTDAQRRLGSHERPGVSRPASTRGGAILTVDLGAVRRNYARLRSEADGAQVAGVVKADAYGLGVGPVADVLYAEGCRRFFVAHLAEALELQALLPDEAGIFVLNGLAPGEEVACARARIVPVLNSAEQIEAWRGAAAATGRTLAAALQVDSGMSRLGLPPAEVEALASGTFGLEGIAVVLVMSHLACADEPEHCANAAQLAAFRALAARLPPAPRSLANSAGTFLGPPYRFDLVRPGIALYGVEPCASAQGSLHPVVRLDAPVIQVRQVRAGTSIGYGFAARAARDTRLATIGLGYADGWPRRLGGRASAFHEGRPLPMVGRVSMDSIVLDIGDAPLRAGDLVELIGPNQPVGTVAETSDTIAYEILTSLGRRFERRYVG